MNLRKKMEKERIEIIRKRTKPVKLGRSLLKKIINEKMSKEEAQKMMFTIQESFRKTGELLVERCLIEKVMTEDEYIKLKKRGLDSLALSPVLMAYFNEIKAGKKDKVIVVTQPYSEIFKQRDFLQKRFKIKIVSCKEAVEMMKKEK